MLTSQPSVSLVKHQRTLLFLFNVAVFDNAFSLSNTDRKLTGDQPMEDLRTLNRPFIKTCPVSGDINMLLAALMRLPLEALDSCELELLKWCFYSWWQ